MTDGCVQFSKNSWHYKLVHFVFPSFFWSESGMVNLCPYMRRVIISIFSVVFVAGWRKLPDRIQEFAWVAQGELIFLTIIVFASAGMSYLDDQDKDILPPFEHLVGYGFAVIAGIVALIDYIKDRPKKEHKTRGLIKTYVESKHEKICPCVEFEDNEY